MPSPLSFGLIASLALLGMSVSTLATAVEDVSTTSYRPTVSNPAALSAPGWLEVEMGMHQQLPGDGSRQTSLPYLLKYAVSPDFGILLGGDAHVTLTDADGTRTRGQGDSTFLLKHRWGLGSGDEAGLEWGFKSPTAISGLGSGKTDYIANGIYSTRVGAHTLDVNLNATRLGAVEAGTGLIRWGWAAALSHPLDAHWSLSAELSGAARRGTTADNQMLVAMAYAPNNRVVIDAGMAVGLSHAAVNRTCFIGVSFLLQKFK